MELPIDQGGQLVQDLSAIEQRSCDVTAALKGVTGLVFVQKST